MREDNLQIDSDGLAVVAAPLLNERRSCAKTSTRAEMYKARVRTAKTDALPLVEARECHRVNLILCISVHMIIASNNVCNLVDRSPSIFVTPSPAMHGATLRFLRSVHC